MARDGTRLSKISWFVSGEQIKYYLPKPKGNLPFFTQERSHVVSFTHEQAIICSQLFADHVAGFMANEKEEKFAWNDNEFYLWKWNDISNVLVETVQPAEQFFFIFHLINE